MNLSQPSPSSGALGGGWGPHEAFPLRSEKQWVFSLTLTFQNVTEEIFFSLSLKRDYKATRVVTGFSPEAF